MISSLLYLIGVLGGIGGLIATIRETVIITPEAGLAILLSSIALLWVGVLIESVEESSTLTSA